jgi:hypothetical protein
LEVWNRKILLGNRTAAPAHRQLRAKFMALDRDNNFFKQGAQQFLAIAERSWSGPTRHFVCAGGELLFNLLAQRYERRSTILTTNLTCSEWVKVFGDEKLTTALLYRLTNHAHILITRGDSYRSSKGKAQTENRTPPESNHQ